MGDTTARRDSTESAAAPGDRVGPDSVLFRTRPIVEDPASVPVKASATVLVLRRADHRNPGQRSGVGGTDRHEVLLLRRNDRSGFVAGVHLYPGGAVDGTDEAIPTSDAGHATGTTPVEDIDRLAIAAAARECFEEAGILLAHTSERRWATEEHVAGVGAEEPFGDALKRLGLTIPVHRFVSWGRWVTPLGAPRRYDTRFFAVEVPTATIRVDGREIVHGAWWDPATALAAERAGEIRFVTPTRKTLERLVGHRWTNPGGP